MMSKLAEVGFTQSYTYFTWRTDKWNLTQYAVEVALGPKTEYMRPNFWPNTPDILHASLQFGGPGMFAIRAVLAATLSPTWGVYSGFELFEHEAVKPGSEEYKDSEKYQLRAAGLPGGADPGQVAGAADHQAERDPPPAPGATTHQRPVVP